MKLNTSKINNHQNLKMKTIIKILLGIIAKSNDNFNHSIRTMATKIYSNIKLNLTKLWFDFH